MHVLITNKGEPGGEAFAVDEADADWAAREQAVRNYR